MLEGPPRLMMLQLQQIGMVIQIHARTPFGGADCCSPAEMSVSRALNDEECTVHDGGGVSSFRSCSVLGHQAGWSRVWSRLLVVASTRGSSKRMNRVCGS
jgi:hypothetical protein